MSKLASTIYVTILVFYLLISQFALQVIRTYQKRKPLGMQTMLGSVILMFVNVSLVSGFMLNGLFSITERFGPFSREKAIGICILDNCVQWHFFLNLFVLLIVKYLSIYQGPILADIDEEHLVQRLRPSLCIAPIFLVWIEFSYLSKFEEMTLFQLNFYGYPKPNSKMEKITFCFVLLNLAIMFLLHIRLEMDTARIQDTEGGFLSKIIRGKINGKDDFIKKSLSGYSIKSARKVVFACLLLLTIVIMRTIGDRGGHIKWIQLIGLGIVEVALPLLLIFKHQGLRSCALNFFRKLFCYERYYSLVH